MGEKKSKKEKRMGFLGGSRDRGKGLSKHVFASKRIHGKIPPVFGDFLATVALSPLKP